MRVSGIRPTPGLNGGPPYRAAGVNDAPFKLERRRTPRDRRKMQRSNATASGFTERRAARVEPHSWLYAPFAAQLLGQALNVAAEPETVGAAYGGPRIRNPSLTKGKRV